MPKLTNEIVCIVCLAISSFACGWSTANWIAVQAYKDAVEQSVDAMEEKPWLTRL